MGGSRDSDTGCALVGVSRQNCLPGVASRFWSVHRAVAGFSSTALDVTQLGQRQGGGVASLLLARGAVGWSS